MALQVETFAAKGFDIWKKNCYHLLMAIKRVYVFNVEMLYQYLSLKKSNPGGLILCLKVDFY
jgi:hypothetical protein